MASRRGGFIRLLLKGRFSTLRPVSQPSQPGPAPCPLSPHICKSLKLSGLDHRDRAGLCQTSDSLPGLNLNGLETLSESTRGGLSSLPPTSSSSPFSSSEHSTSDGGLLFIPLKGFFLWEHWRVEAVQAAKSWVWEQYKRLNKGREGGRNRLHKCVSSFDDFGLSAATAYPGVSVFMPPPPLFSLSVTFPLRLQASH